MEKIMSKTSAEPRELRDNELDAVSGGIIAVLIGLLLPAHATPTPSVTSDGMVRPASN
jgi:hypothetical protein